MNLKQEDRIRCEKCGRMSCVNHQCKICERSCCRQCIKKIKFDLKIENQDWSVGNLHFNLFWMCHDCEHKIGVGYLNNKDELDKAREEIMDVGKNLVPTLKKIKMLTVMSDYRINAGDFIEAFSRLRKYNDTGDGIKKQKNIEEENT